MKKYLVNVPISGYCVVEVRAVNKKEAIKKALQREDLSLDNVYEWDAYERLIEGNVCYTHYNNACVEELSDE